MTDITEFESPEEIREYLRSELSRTDGSAIEIMENIHELLHSLTKKSAGTDFEEVVGPLVKEWSDENPDLAQDLAETVTQISTGVNEAARQFGIMFSGVITAAKEWGRDNPETVEGLKTTWDMLSANGQAAWWRSRYDTEGLPIAFDQAVRLAFFLMAMRIPYVGKRSPDESDLMHLFDFEMRAIYELREGHLSELIEGAKTSRLDFRTVQAALAFLLESNEPFPTELNDWALQVAAGNIELPRPRLGRNADTNVVRDELIVKTVEALVDCGLTASRNDASKPQSACDAVSKALSAHGVTLGHAAIQKIWQSNRHQKLSP